MSDAGRRPGSCLVAVAGLSGSGKSTAVRLLQGSLGGDVVYLGEVVLEWCREMGYPETRDSELRARKELQDLHGPAFAIERLASRIQAALSRGSAVFLDAVFRPTELDRLLALAAPHAFHLVAIESSFRTRCARLVARTDRPFSEGEVRSRDGRELNELGTGKILARCTAQVVNEGSLEQFEAELTAFAERLIGPAPLR